MLAPVALGPALVHPISARSVQSRRDPDNVRRRGAEHQLAFPWRKDESEYSLFAVGGWLHICGARNSSVLR
jgi:hypothetical protein